LAVLADQLRTELPAVAETRVAAGLALAVVALGLALWSTRTRYGVESPTDRIWLDFRDSYGLFWSARVAARLNQAAAQHHWPLRLRWSGIASQEDRTPDGGVGREREMFGRMFESLLLRFVSPGWIAARRAAARPPEKSPVAN
jgi:hypothetical protein